MSSLAEKRLMNERKKFRKNRPFGFYCKPNRTTSGIDLFRWECGIIGKKGGPWEGGLYKLDFKFTKEYPQRCPHIRFITKIQHPNVFTSGDICLSLIQENKDYKPSLSITQLLLGIQELLDNPNVDDPANGEMARLYKRNKTQYLQNVKAQALKFKQTM